MLVVRQDIRYFELSPSCKVLSRLRYLVVDHFHRSWRLIAGHSVWDLWWTKWHWTLFFSKHFVIPPSLPINRCSTLISMLVPLLHSSCLSVSRYSIVQKDIAFFKVALGQAFLAVSLFPPVSVIPPVFHTYLHCQKVSYKKIRGSIGKSDAFSNLGSINRRVLKIQISCY